MIELGAFADGVAVLGGDSRKEFIETIKKLTQAGIDQHPQNDY